MKKLLFVLLIAFAYCECSPVSRAAKSNNALALDLYRQLAEEEGNLFFSPISLSSALCIPYMGAKEETLKQMSEVLHFDSDSDKAGRSFGVLTQHLCKPTLDLCNSLFIQEGYAVKSAFLNQVAHHFIAGIQYVDYQKETEQARELINTYVEEGTHGHIKDLLPDGAVSSDTRAVIINTIYMNAPWKQEFASENTYPQLFHSDETKDVPMMHGRGHYLMAKRDNYTVLELPYSGDLACCILLPHEGVLLAEVEKENFLTSLEMVSTFAEVALPKFSMETTIPIKECLEKMGMNLPFSCMADFSGISRDLYISDVIQKAKLIVEEKGTEAAAATGIIMNTKCVLDEEKPVYFTADRPFLFFIVDKPTGAVLFAGRLAQP